MFDFDERYKGGERAVLVNVDFVQENSCEDLNELKLLAKSAGAVVVGILSCNRKIPDPRFFIGSGKVEELLTLVSESEAETVIFNHELSPSQERNLEKELKCKVITRTALILDIFAQRARTREGKLQVELAQLRYLQTRLVRGWTHLERQKGGIGMRGGPGETQLESDRRLLRERITALKADLDLVERRRTQSGRARVHNNVPVVSFVGYTNAGKSTLFNLLTDSEVYAADQLFATLDPTLRSVEMPHIGKIILADTVGFIRHLPHDLVAAFKSTLSETRDADLQLHVIDFSDERVKDNIESVRSVLEQIEADDVPQLRVYNKIDRLDKVNPGIVYNEHGRPEAVYISAARNVGIDFLYKAIAELLGNDLIEIVVKLPGTEGGLRNRLYQMGAVSGETYSQTGEMILTVKHQRVELAQLNSRSNGALERYCVKPKNFTFKVPEF